MRPLRRRRLIIGRLAAAVSVTRLAAGPMQRLVAFCFTLLFAIQTPAHALYLVNSKIVTSQAEERATTSSAPPPPSLRPILLTEQDTNKFAASDHSRGAQAIAVDNENVLPTISPEMLFATDIAKSDADVANRGNYELSQKEDRLPDLELKNHGIDVDIFDADDSSVDVDMQESGPRIEEDLATSYLTSTTMTTTSTTSLTTTTIATTLPEMSMEKEDLADLFHLIVVSMPHIVDAKHSHWWQILSDAVRCAMRDCDGAILNSKTTSSKVRMPTIIRRRRRSDHDCACTRLQELLEIL